MMVTFGEPVCAPNATVWLETRTDALLAMPGTGCDHIADHSWSPRGVVQRGQHTEAGGSIPKHEPDLLPSDERLDFQLCGVTLAFVRRQLGE